MYKEDYELLEIKAVLYNKRQMNNKQHKLIKRII